MKRKILSVLVAAAVLAGSLAFSAYGTSSGATETLRALGIMIGDENGNLNLSAKVSRAEFAKLAVASSPYADTVGSGLYAASLFQDVKQGHWAGEYIKAAVEQGWFTGYVDGTFRPASTITLEEAATVLLRLLGYDASGLAGSFPTAQLSKASAIGLLDDVSAEKGETLTRGDCAAMIYNLLLAKTSEGKIYAETLGYTVTNGEVDYAALITADTKGPYVAENSNISLPFRGSSVTVYRNGKVSSLSGIQQYDVYYYNSNIRTVWAYSDKAAGTITDIAPNTASPSSVTVAGNVYAIGTSDAAYQLSSQGTFGIGDVVTLLLGMNGDVVEVLSGEESSVLYYGMVLSAQQQVLSGSAAVRTQVKMVCTDGVIRTFYSKNTPSEGDVVSASTGSDGTVIKTVSTKSIRGTVDSLGTKLGNYKFAEDIEILDVDEDGGYAVIYPSRLAGATLESKNVQYYALNENGDICRLILKEATGDTVTYGYLTAANSQSAAESGVSGSYQYYIDGTAGSLNTSGVSYSVKTGGAAFRYAADGTVKSIQNIDSVKLTELSSLYAMAGSRKYVLDEAVQALVFKAGSGYHAVSLSSINAEEYSLVGWYDNFGCTAGGRIRIIVATALS